MKILSTLPVALSELVDAINDYEDHGYTFVCLVPVASKDARGRDLYFVIYNKPY